MARTWLSVTVELLGGRGQELWPCPGRIFAIGPAHTFTDLANAINSAFARWDLAHLSMFTLDDGRVVTDPEVGDDLIAGGPGPLSEALDIDSAKVHQTVKPGAEFQYTFDLGDDWTHRCVVAPEMIDPKETLGVSPRAPLPYWGWVTSPTSTGVGGPTTTVRARCPRDRTRRTRCSPGNGLADNRFPNSTCGRRSWRSGPGTRTASSTR